MLDHADPPLCILNVKTSMTILYTPVFLPLDRDYWNEDAETKLRASMALHLPGVFVKCPARGRVAFDASTPAKALSGFITDLFIMETALITGHWRGKAEPIYIVAGGSSRGKGGIRDARFTNISAEAESEIVIYGSPDSIIRDVTLDHIRLEIRAPNLPWPNPWAATSICAGQPRAWLMRASSTICQPSTAATSMRRLGSDRRSDPCTSDKDLSHTRAGKNRCIVGAVFEFKKERPV